MTQLRFTLSHVGLFDRFVRRIFSATEVARGKLAPDLFLYAASRMGVEPRRCVVVEDSPAGIEAARVAGTRALGFAALTPAAWLEGAWMVFDDMVQLPALIGKSVHVDGSS